MADFVLAIIMALLAWDNAPLDTLSQPQVVAHLEALAVEIAAAGDDAPRLITLAFRETRFGYREAASGGSPRSSVGCGVFQQWPTYAHGGATTCEALAAPAEAVRQARAYLRYIEKRWGKSEGAICHYFSGNTCKGKAQRTYTQEHLRTLRMVRAWWKRGRV